MNTLTFFTEEKQRLEAEIQELEAQLKKMPAGTLISYKPKEKDTDNYSLWYKETTVNGRKKREYLPKAKEAQARILAEKSFKFRQLCDKKNELESINRYLTHRKEERYSKMLDADSPYRELLINRAGWENEEYEKSEDHPEHLTIPAPKDEYVRSKSEAMIAQALFDKGIPYRYECIHNLDGSRIASDFTILHPKTEKEYIWEHFGLSDNPEYARNISIKLPKYLKEGYLPGYNLILTFENNEHPLSFIKIEEIVQQYFL